MASMVKKTWHSLKNDSFSETFQKIKWHLSKKHLYRDWIKNIEEKAPVEELHPDYCFFPFDKEVMDERAAYYFNRYIEVHPDANVIYCDYDFVNEENKRQSPFFKPDFNLDYFLSCNYVAHGVAVKKELLQKGETSFYTFLLQRLLQGEDIYHIPRVLCHRKMSSSSDEMTEVDKNALEAYWKSKGLEATVELTKEKTLRSRFKVEKEPLISIIIPNKDHIHDLKTCIESLERDSYSNKEILIVENNSEEPETFEYYNKLQGTYDNISVLYYKDRFNYSRINNFAVKQAKGEYFLFLNNDTELMEHDMLLKMVEQMQRPEVGIVGAKLFFADHTIQHAGVIMGFGDGAGHCFQTFDSNDLGPFFRLSVPVDYSALTAACLMVKREAFCSAKGFEEEFEVAFNDVDMCLKVGALGYLVVYLPYAMAYHYESKSRGYEVTPEKKQRYTNEANLLKKKWIKILEKGDPCYNPNLTLLRGDFSVAEKSEYERIRSRISKY